MPKAVGLTFEFEDSGVKLSQELLEELEDCFNKYNSIPSPFIEPDHVRKTFLHHGLDKTKPAMYNMICWMTEANEYSGTEGITFDEFI